MARTRSAWPAALNREEAADYIGVGTRTLDTLQARSELIPVEVAGMKRFRREDLDEYLRGRPDWEGRK